MSKSDFSSNNTVNLNKPHIFPKVSSLTPTLTMTGTNGTITLIPASEGYVVDFENPQMQFVVKSYTVAAVEMTLAFIFLVQRLYTKVVIMKKFQLEDSKS
jgi:hypothetical protein